MGADTASPEASAVLGEVMEGKVPLRVQARTSSDIESAYRLCGEFGVPFTLVDPVEAYRVLDLLSLPALLAALTRPASGEGPSPDVHAAGKVLARAGFETRALDLQLGRQVITEGC